MKNLILASALLLSFSSFAYQDHSDVDCTALSESTDRVGKDIKNSEKKDDKKKKVVESNK